MQPSLFGNILIFVTLGVFLAPSGTNCQQDDAGLMRKKRFLPPFDAPFPAFPDRLMRISDRVREMTHGLLDDANRETSSVIRRRISPFGEIFGSESSPKTTKVRPQKNKNPNREIEGDEDDEFDGGKDEGTSEVVSIDVPRRQPSEDDGLPGFNPFDFTFGLFTPWWRGPNVCVERNEVDEPEKATNVSSFMINFESTQCVPSDSSYICTKRIQNNGMKKTSIVKYQCCHGFVRNEGRPGCHEVQMDDLMQTLKVLETRKFADMLETAGLTDKLKTENFTVFAPSDDDIVAFEDDAVDNEILEAPKPKRMKDISYFVGGHLIDGFLNLNAAENDDIFPSLNGKTSIRINKYRSYSTLYTANCILIDKKNHFATNGLVHLVSDVLPLPRKSVADVIAGGYQFSIFYNLLKETDLFEELKDPKKSWTIFAPTDTAFKSLDKDMLQRLLSGEGCAESILRQHVVKGTVCAAAVEDRARVLNNLGRVLTLTRGEGKSLKVEDAAVNVTNIMGTNGVVHFIDDVLVPPEAHTVEEVLKKAERSDFLELIKTADLESTFKGFNNVTLFVPSKDAIKSIPEDKMKKWKENPEELRQILLYHVAAPKTMSADFGSNKELATLAEDQNIRMELHGMFPGLTMGATAQCSVVVNHDNKACGAVLHLVDKMLVPPKNNIIQTLKSMEGHKTLLKLLESTDLESKLANEGEGPYTLLAPTDEAFERFEKKTLDELLVNKTRAEQILRMHVIPESLCCSSVNPVFPFRHHYVRTLEGNMLSLHRSGHLDRVRFGPARAVSCDNAARNGLVHSVNRVILPSQRRQIPSIFDMDIFRLF